MKRVTRGQIERALRFPAPRPPEDLGAKLKAGIPDDLSGAARPEAGGVRPAPRPVRRGASLLIAASVLAAVGAGWLATRLFEERAAEVLPMAVADAQEEQSRALDAAAPRAPALPPPAPATREEILDRLEPADRPRRSQSEPESAFAPVAEPASTELASAPRDAAASAGAARGMAAGDDDSASADAAAPQIDSTAARSPAPASETPPRAAGAPSRAHPAPRRMVERDDAGATAAVADEDRSIEAQNRSIEAQNRKIAELEAQKRRLEREMVALPHAELGREAEAEDGGDAADVAPSSASVRVTWLVSAQEELSKKRDALRAEMERLRSNDGRRAATEVERAPGVERAPVRPADAAATSRRSALVPSVSRDGDLAFVDAAAQPLSTLAVSSRPGSLAALLDDVEPEADGAGVAELLDAASRDFPDRLDTIDVAGAPLPLLDENRVVLLVTAVVADRADRSLDAAGVANAIEVAIDPAVASRYRLLASHARPLPARVSSSLTGARESAPLHRVSALLEIELASPPLADAGLVALRLRHDGRVGAAAGARAPEVSRAVGARDVASEWSVATPELRLAILASELARTPAEEASLAVSTIRTELGRLLEAGLANDPVARGEIARLLALAADPAESASPAPWPDG